MFFSFSGVFRVVVKFLRASYFCFIMNHFWFWFFFWILHYRILQNWNGVPCILPGSCGPDAPPALGSNRKPPSPIWGAKFASSSVWKKAGKIEALPYPVRKWVLYSILPKQFCYPTRKSKNPNWLNLKLHLKRLPLSEKRGNN